MNSPNWSNLFKKCESNFLSTLLQINHLLPRVSARYLVPPSPHIFSQSEWISLVSVTDQVLSVRQVWRISQIKFITSQEPSLLEPFFRDVKHFRQLLFILPENYFVLLDSHSKRNASWSTCWVPNNIITNISNPK